MPEKNKLESLRRKIEDINSINHQIICVNSVLDLVYNATYYLPEKRRILSTVSPSAPVRWRKSNITLTVYVMK